MADRPKKIEKGTHIDIFNSIVKQGDEYVAVLSCTSVDRDGDEMSPKALRKMAKDEDYTIMLIDHENKIENQIGEWTNKRVVKTGDTYSLVATPKFYKSNPKAQYIKNMLNEGAKMGISIGAKVLNYTEKSEKVNGWSTYIYEELELMEASFVAIPSNRHGQAMAVAKSLKKRENKTSEDKKMTDEMVYTQKDFDSKLSENKQELEKKLSETEKQFGDYKADTEKKLTEANAKLAEVEKQVSEKSEELAKAKESLKELETIKVFKAKMENSDLQTKSEDEAKKEEEESLRKNYEAGNL